ncbi:uncharacterized protein [Spinacia oleracea]|uniref:Endonuclease/exonuclease/phosphatase domain-containing protein n=1 Tax=Spinacia oleracea TaxID=3562 RepID=A0ABM3R3X5_SPIOL|nr:uncharacterized protein LOC110789660 [Spinacia oleracea]
MIVCAWNIRGLNDPNKTRTLKQFLSKNNVDVIAVMETRVKDKNKDKVQQKIGKAWTWHCNSACNPRGRIWVGWNMVNGSVLVHTTHEKFIHGEIMGSKGVFVCFFTAVYGLHTVETRRGLWASLTGIAASVSNAPWLIIGDFNAVLNTQDRIGGAAVSRYETHDFEEFIANTSGLGDARVASRIDRALGNGCWMLQFGHIAVDYGNTSILDHSPLLTVVTLDWNRPIQGNPLSCIWFKLKRLKSKLKQLHKEEFAGIDMRIQQAQVSLDSVQAQLVDDPSDILLQVEEKRCTKDLIKWLSVEESALKQKSRINWLSNGDSNSRFFFASVKQRRNTNRISLLYNDQGLKLTDPDVITREIQNFYNKLLGDCCQ